MSAVTGRRLSVRGTVQGVGFRPWVHRLAHELGLRGRVWNTSSGVEIDVFGPEEQLELFASELTREAPPAARVSSIEQRRIEGEPPEGFAILASDAGAERELAVPPDLATCAACLRELGDSADRRHGYAFTN